MQNDGFCSVQTDKCARSHLDKGNCAHGQRTYAHVCTNTSVHTENCPCLLGHLPLKQTQNRKLSPLKKVQVTDQLTDRLIDQLTNCQTNFNGPLIVKRRASKAKCQTLKKSSRNCFSQVALDPRRRHKCETVRKKNC